MKETKLAAEEMFFSPLAVKSRDTKGRKRYEEECPFRTEFQRDRDRIIHCKAFRRLKNKTQVFIAPFGDHFRTRMTHTLEVTQIARSIAGALNLNEDLAEAIALGHDLGHTPFGHIGEKTLNRISEEGFRHNEQSVRIVEVIEKNGEGLNLTYEVLDGILNHGLSAHPSTAEGRAVLLADKIAYINHDLDDALRAGLITEDMVPQSAASILGKTTSARINNMIRAIVEESDRAGEVKMSAEVEQAMLEMRAFLFSSVYTENAGNRDNDKADLLVEFLYNNFLKHPETLPEEYKTLLDRFSVSRVVCDYIAGMSDTYAIDLFKKLTLPRTLV